MPYLHKDLRKLIKLTFEGQPFESAGHLNYLFTLIINEYKKERGESYQIYNDIIGALEGAKLELYRRKIAPYEDTKIKSNGDVY
jgi:hypothetical protein